MEQQVPVKPSDPEKLTQAGDVMTHNVTSVGPDAPVGEIARLLLENRISAMPVVNSDGTPIGMVSEGDLVARDEQDRVTRSDWWLALITGKRQLDERSQAKLAAQTASDIMSAPLVTVTEETGVAEVARLLAIHHIKRVPVVRDGRLVGIISRADLLRVVAAGQDIGVPQQQSEHRGFLSSLFSEYRLPAEETVEGNRPPEPKPAQHATARLAAGDFRQLVEDFHAGEAHHRDDTRRAAAEQRRQRTKALIDEHVFDESWKGMLHRAQQAAESGQTECMLLRFPTQLCIDGGRAINTAEKHWPVTLRGEAAEIYLRWERDLKPCGFSLSARVVDFPDGKPGDIGLFLVWGE